MPHVDGLPKLSDAHRWDVAECPRCKGGGDLRGPTDGKRNRWFVFTRVWFCRTCWWDRQIEVFDDAAEAKDRHARYEKRRQDRAKAARA